MAGALSAVAAARTAKVERMRSQGGIPSGVNGHDSTFDSRQQAARRRTAGLSHRRAYGHAARFNWRKRGRECPLAHSNLKSRFWKLPTPPRPSCGRRIQPWGKPLNEVRTAGRCGRTRLFDAMSGTRGDVIRRVRGRPLPRGDEKRPLDRSAASVERQHLAQGPCLYRALFLRCDFGRRPPSGIERLLSIRPQGQLDGRDAALLFVGHATA
jgi:hypothetical protein